MRTLRRYNLARPVGRLSGLDSRIEVFPTVLLALPDADLADAAAESGYGPMVAAMERASALGPSPDRASVLLVASGICNGRDVIGYEEKVDFAAYDAAFSMTGGSHGA